jgi:uncharacterized protein DUF1496
MAVSRRFMRQRQWIDVMAGRIVLFCISFYLSWCAAAVAETGPAPFCFYESKTFSEGALICVRKSVMLNCGSDGARLTWKIVTDRELSDRCEAPAAIVRARRFVHHARIARPSPPVAQPAAAKCFMFNGNRYCE